MNAESFSDFDSAGGELTGLLREAVEQIRSTPAPADVAARVIERAAKGGATPAAPSWFGVGIAAAVAFLAIAVGVAVFRGARQPPDRPVLAEAKAPGTGPSAAVPAPSPSTRQAPFGSVPLTPPPPVAAGADGGGRARGARPAPMMMGVSPSRFMAVASDATVIVSTGGDKPIRLGEKQPWTRETTLHVWDWSRGEESRPLKTAAPGGMAVSPDGKWVVTRDGQLVDVGTGESRRIGNFGGDVRGMRFSPDGTALLLQVRTGDNDATARLINFPGGNVRVELPGQWAHTFACAFTADGKQVLLMDRDRVLRRYDAKTGKEVARYEPAFENSIRAIAVSPDARRVAAAGTRGDLYVWGIDGGKAAHKLSAQGQRLPDLTRLTGMDSLAFSPDGKRVAGGAGFAVVIWDAETGEVAQLLKPHSSGGATHLRFSKDGTRLTTVHDLHGTNGPAGEDLLVYPTVRQWDGLGGQL